MSRYTGTARWVHMVTASKPPNTDKLKFSINILIHKNDPQIPALTAEVEAAKAQGFPSGFPADANTCLVDCAIEWPDNLHTRDYMAFSCNTNADQGRPHFVDMQVNPIMDPSADDSTTGKIVHVDIGIASYDKGSKGVKAYLNGVMVTEQDGPIPREGLTSKPNAAQMFAGVTGGVAAPIAAPTPAPAPVTAAPPVASAPPPAPAPAPTPAAPPAAPQKVMTEKAGGATYEAFIAQGWTDERMVAEGYMIQTSF